MDLKEVIAGRTLTESQNLANPTKISKVNRPEGFYKSIGLDVLAVGAAALFGYLYFLYLSRGLSLWILLGSLTLFAIVTALQTFLTKETGRRILVLFLETAALFVFFRNDDLRVIGVTAALVFVLSVWGYLASRAQLGNAIEIPFFSVTRNVLGKFTTALLIFMILIYVPQIGQGTPFVSQQSFSGFFDWAAGILNNMYPGVSLTGTFGDFTTSIAKMELANNKSFQSLNSTEQAAAVNQAASQLTQSFSKSSATPISSSDSASSAFYNLIVGALNAWKSQSSGSFVIGWAIAVFFILRGIGIVFVWFAQFASLIFYEILLAAGFMKITEETQPREAIGY